MPSDQGVAMREEEERGYKAAGNLPLIHSLKLK
jgi:hypothetical protein